MEWVGVCLAVAVVAGILLWAFRSEPNAGATPAVPRRGTGDLVGDDLVASASSDASDRSSARAGDASEPEHDDVLVASSSADASRESVDAFRRELESTLYERMDPGVLLAEAQRLADMVVGLKADSQPTIDGGAKFDCAGVPDGLSAALEIHRSANYPSILSMEVQCDQSEPVFLEGALRKSPTLRIKVWSNAAGDPTNMVIATNLAPAYRESLAAGIDINTGTTICGLSYHLDVREPSKSGMKLLVMKDGLLTDQAVPTNLIGSAWPQMDNVEHFTSTLLALQQTLNQ